MTATTKRPLVVLVASALVLAFWVPIATADHELDRDPVTPGAFCSQAEAGHFARTVTGLLMKCTTTATDDRNRWRDAEFAGSFYDDDGNTHEGFIEAISAEDVTRGCNPPFNDRYCPDELVSREQMAAFLVRALGLTDADHPGFSDVEPGSTFDQDIRKLAKAGVTRGCNPPINTRFCPKDPVSREQMAAFVARGFEYVEAEPPGIFTDVVPGSTFDEDIRKLAKAGVTRGCNPPINDRYCPKDFVKRDQMASFIGRAMELTPVQP